MALHCHEVFVYFGGSSMNMHFQLHQLKSISFLCSNFARSNKKQVMGILILITQVIWEIIADNYKRKLTLG